MSASYLHPLYLHPLPPQVQADSLRTFREAREGGASGARQYVNMLYSLLKLRQACNHPWLVRGGRKWHKTGERPGRRGRQREPHVALLTVQYMA